MMNRIPIKDFIELDNGITKTIENSIAYNNLLEGILDKYPEARCETSVEPYMPGENHINICYRTINCKDKTEVSLTGLPLCKRLMKDAQETAKNLELATN